MTHKLSISQRNAVPLPRGRLRPHPSSQLSHEVKAFFRMTCSNPLWGMKIKPPSCMSGWGSRVLCVSGTEQPPFPQGSPLLILVLILIRAWPSSVVGVDKGILGSCPGTLCAQCWSLRICSVWAHRNKQPSGQDVAVRNQGEIENLPRLAVVVAARGGD